MSVCVHCFRETSRIRHSPAAVQDVRGLDEGVKGRWWRPEELGLVDYSLSTTVPSVRFSVASSPRGGGGEGFGQDDPDFLPLEGRVAPLLPGILEGVEGLQVGAKGITVQSALARTDNEGEDDDGVDSRAVRTEGDETERDDDDGGEDRGDGVGMGVNEDDFTAPSSSPASPSGQLSSPRSPPPQQSMSMWDKKARCKSCGELIARDMESIEQHMEECVGAGGRRVSVARTASVSNSGAPGVDYFPGMSSPKFLGSLPRRPDLDNSRTRIIYRTARANSKSIRPREVNICLFSLPCWTVCLLH